MLYLVCDAKSGGNGEPMDTGSASSSMPSGGIQQDDVDVILEKEDGRIFRKRNDQLYVNPNTIINIKIFLCWFVLLGRCCHNISSLVCIVSQHIIEINKGGLSRKISILHCIYAYSYFLYQYMHLKKKGTSD